MRVVFATDRIGPLSSLHAGEALATGWQLRRPQDDLAVVPLGAAGAGLVEAYADLVDAEIGLAPDSGRDADDPCLLLDVRGPQGVLVGVDGPTPDDDGAATSAPWGEAIARALRDNRPAGTCDSLAVDLGGCTARDGGAGLLGALGVLADVPLDLGASGLAGITAVDLAPARALLRDLDGLVAVVPAGQTDRALLGLRGITSLHGAELREAGRAWDAGDLLAVDARLQAYARAVAPDIAELPGAGGCGGAAFALAALGARISTGPQWLAERAGLLETIGAADLVVTGSDGYDFAARGGETVEAVVGWAGAAMRPVVAVAGVVTISPREMRAHGLDAAYPLFPEAVPGSKVSIRSEQLVDRGERLARTWAG